MLRFGVREVASGLTNSFSYPSAFLETPLFGTRSCPKRDHLAILHAFIIGAGHRPLNHAHPVVSRSMPWYGDPLLRIPNGPKPFCRPHLCDKSPLTRALISLTDSVRKEFVEHTSAKGLGRGYQTSHALSSTLSVPIIFHGLTASTGKNCCYLKYYVRALARVS